MVGIPRVPAQGAAGSLHARDHRAKAAEARLAYLASFPERNPNPVVEAEPGRERPLCEPGGVALFPDLGAPAHAWLADWAETVRLLRKEQAGSAGRDIAVGDRVYQQSFYLFAEEGVVRIYGRDITERRHAEDEIRQRHEELRVANEELASFNRVAVGRELRMVELKKQVNELYAKAGLPSRYDLDFEEGKENH